MQIDGPGVDTAVYTGLGGCGRHWCRPLPHAAIVAREYGIPAVLGVGYATTKFHDGDTVWVDGTKGEAAKVG